MKKIIISLAVVASLASCADKENDKPQENVEQTNKVMTLNINEFKWTREPESCTIKGDTIEVVTKPGTDLWQRTYYHFRNDNAPVFQMETEEKFFSFVVKPTVFRWQRLLKPTNFLSRSEMELSKWP